MGSPEIPRWEIFNEVAGVGHVGRGWFARGGAYLKPSLFCQAMCEYFT